MKKIFCGLFLFAALLTGRGYCTDFAITYNNTTKTYSARAVLPIAQGGTNSATQNFVDTSTNQTINGTKTFVVIPALPASDPATDNQASRKAYTDTKISKTTAGEINATTEKTSLADDDIFLIEDSAAAWAKKKVKKSNVSSIRMQVFTANGTFTVPTGTTKVYITATGAGGGGGSGSGGAGGGGGAAGMLIKYPFGVTAGHNHTIVIGAGGAGGTSGGNGTAGTNTTFNTSVVALFGNPGLGSNWDSGGAGGGGLDAVNGTAGTYNIKGGTGGGAAGAGAGAGGGTIFGPGAIVNQAAGANTGAGGGGGGDGSNGGNGGSGMAIIEW